MGLRGPNPKSGALRIFEGAAAHRPLPAPSRSYLVGIPERPKGMTAPARRIWDEYIDQIAPLGSIRLVDGFALRRLCEDVALLEELQSGMRKVAADLKREERVDKARVQAITSELAEAIVTKDCERVQALEQERAEIHDRRLSGGAMLALAKTHDGRRIVATINSLASRIARAELQFGLTPASAARLNDGSGIPAGGGLMRVPDIEDALCG